VKPLTAEELELLKVLIERNEWNVGQTYRIYAEVSEKVIAAKRRAAGLPEGGIY